MNPAEPHQEPNGKPHVPTEQDLLAQVQRRAQRGQRGLRDGDPTLMRQLAAVGVMGWIVVVPTLLGMLGGRWLDRVLQSGITCTGAGLMLGLLLGCWSAWRWMHES